jgi:acylphosphatase
MALKRANIFVSGNVQMANFRGFVKTLADSLEIKGYADNLPDGRVQIVCEGEEESILKLKTS